MNVKITYQEIGGLLEGRAAREWPVIEHAFRLQDGNGLEEQGFAAHLYAHEHEVPVPFANVLLLHAKCSVFIEMTEQTAKKFNFAGQMPIDLDQAFLLGVHDERAFHVMENLR